MTGPTILTLAFLVATVNGASYFITSPREFHRGSVYNINVNILNTTGVDLTATIVDETYNYTTRRYDRSDLFSIGNVFNEGETGTLSIPIKTDFKCHSRCKLAVRAKGGLQFERSINVPVKSKTLSVLIQTDKAIYKPGQKVRYRVLAVYPDLQLYHGKLDFTIKDTKQNRVKFSQGLVSSTGVIEGSFVLSDQPVFGEWHLRAQVQETGDVGMQYIQIADYQLPRFEVKVDLPPYALTEETKLAGTVQAKYTFGQPVKGMVELHIGPNRGPDYCGKAPKSVQISFKIDGEAKFEMPKTDIARVVSIYNKQDVKVTAFVKEEATGVRLNGSSVITYYSKEHEIEFLQNTPSVFKPGLPYKAFIRVFTPDKLPPKGDDLQVSVYTFVHYSLHVADQHLYGTPSFKGTYPLPGKNLTLPASGVLAVDLDIPNNATEITIQATFKGRTAKRDVEKTYSKSNNYIQITALDKNIKAKNVAKFNLKGTEHLKLITYEIYSRGTMALSKTLDCKGQSSVDFEVYVSPSMAPTGHLIAYYTRMTDEVVADSLAFSVDGIFENEVTIDFSQPKSEPHKEVSVILTADANSTVNVLAVDQSVLLLKTGNDITPKKVSDAVSQFDLGKSPDNPEYALSYSAASAKEVFSETGLSIITDVEMIKPPPSDSDYTPPPRRLRGPHAQGPQGMAMYSGINQVVVKAPQPRKSDVPVAELEPVNRLRTVFPEAWLWTTSKIGDEGKATLHTVVPDTITSWIASAFATNPLTGLGVATNTAKLQVFRPFFVSLTYPHTVTRHEQVVIQATVFNYLPTDMKVTVEMKKSAMFDIYLQVLPDDTKTHVFQDMAKTITKYRRKWQTIKNVFQDMAKTITVKSEEQGVVYFPILAKEVGVANIEVSARCSSAADGVKRQIHIKAEGAPVSFNYPTSMYNRNKGDVYETTTLLPLPKSHVKGSESARVKVTGDLIGASLDSLDKLLNLPTGCGEQSMVKFAPNLYIYQYLEATGQLNDFSKKRILGYLESGYQRQMNYQRHDGGFSAFGNRDESGSMWLTSLVAKTLSKSKDVIFVDELRVLDGPGGAVGWIVDRQNEDGSFSEFGQVLDMNIQGNKAGPALTATALLAIQENMRGKGKLCSMKKFPCPIYEGWKNATLKARDNLEQLLESGSEISQFDLALVTYALSVAKSKDAKIALEKLNSHAKVEGAFKYWSDNGTVTPPKFLSSWKPPHIQARPIDILITSYAVLTYLELGYIEETIPSVIWLVNQRNSLGGFASTQDTTVALEALSAYATVTKRPETDLNIEITSDSNEEIAFKVNDENALDLQMRQFETMPSKVVMKASGPGCALLEMVYSFNVNHGLTSPSFDVSTVLLDDQLDQFNLMICTKWLWDRETGMVVQEIGIPSGFEPDTSSLADVAGVKRAERKSTTVAVYFDKITKTSLCYSVLMSRTAKVARTQPAFVKTYDYYEPENQATVFYQPKSLKKATICDVCPKCCH